MREFQIEPVSDQLDQAIHYKIDQKTKPTGALGSLEKIALQICKIQQTISPSLVSPHIFTFAADHGIAKEGVSNYPSEVTALMVLNFLKGGAAINVFCKQNQIDLTIVDAGVNQIGMFPAHHDHFIQQPMGLGTKNFINEPAMTLEECEKAIEIGASIIADKFEEDKSWNVVGFGEMGISNTSSAALIMHLITSIPLSDYVGRGTGLDDAGLKHKLSVLEQALKNSSLTPNHSPTDILHYFGGFEIAMMCGAMLQAAENKQLILIDGFIATATFLIAHKIFPAIKDYAFFCHLSDEDGHQRMLEHLEVQPILKLNMRLGEGTGCALTYPIIKASVAMMNEMSSFEDLNNLKA